MNFLQRIFSPLKNGNAVSKLIFINVAVFLVLRIIALFFQLFNLEIIDTLSLFALPAEIKEVALKPWTLISYMYFHQDFIHILFNMISLFWFGRIFLMYFSEKQLIGLYILGGLLGGIVYLLAFNIFPFFSSMLTNALLLGASGSIMAIIVSAALKSPNMELQLLLVGHIKLKYIAIITVCASFFGITSRNAGGEFAHLGGALAGYLFIVSLQKNKDITAGINWIIDLFANRLKPRKKVKLKSTKTFRTSKMNDAEYKVYKARKIEDIDKILDKVKTSGYESLSSEEKKKLFDLGKNN